MEKGEVFDYFQEVARSAFADMLHDTERNQKYSEALKETIDYVKSQGKKANVLDIGTGTGLLAMLASQHGADSVVTIETFSPVSHFARKIIEQNGFKDKIQVINKHSTEVKVGPNEEMKQKANILVAEVFDTELIGEGAIKTYNEAHKNLLDDECLSIPHKANVYVQIVKSPKASSWFSFKDIKIDENLRIVAPEDVAKCKGLSSINDIQLSQFPLEDFTPLSDPIKMCDFNFSNNTKIQQDETFNISFNSTEDANEVIIFFWWDIHMNKSGSILLSCAPYWAHPDVISSENEIEKRDGIPWRDHWMQGCYYIPKRLKKNQKYTLKASHDEFSWFFDILDSEKESIEHPMCSCCFHVCNSRNQIMQINDDSKRDAFKRLLEKIELNNALFIGDHSLIPLIAAHISKANRITVLQEDEMSFKSLKMFIECNNLSDKINLINDLTYAKGITTHLIADPYFNASIQPLDNITQISTVVDDLCKLNQHQLKNVYPLCARIYAVPVHFINLHKIRWPLESSCEGFNHAIFDDVIELASKIADDNVEPFSLWEYPCYALGKRSKIFEVNFLNADADENARISQQVTNIEIENFTRNCNGIAFWIEWILDENDIIISTGPLNEIVSGELINWKFDRQAVHLIPHKDVSRILNRIDIKLHWNKDEITFDFDYHPCEK